MGERRSRQSCRPRKKVPELTLDRAVRLLEAALSEPELRLPRASALVDYHVRRNEVARKSHAKTWRAKHRRVKFLRPPGSSNRAAPRLIVMRPPNRVLDPDTRRVILHRRRNYV